MPCRTAHLVAGAIAGAVVASLHPGFGNFETGQRILLGAGIGALGGILPDLLEPATSPFHRGAAHSVVAFGIATRGSLATRRPIPAVLLAGFSSHLLLDAKTPAGLPWVMKGA